MANPLDRTWFNTLIDDDGSGTVGTIWNKTQVDGLLDTVDARLTSIVDRIATPVTGQIPFFADADSIQGAPEFTVDAFAGGILLNSNQGLAYLQLKDSTQPVDQKIFRIANTSNNLLVQALNDAAASAITAIMITRQGDLHITKHAYVVGGSVVFPATQIPSANVNALDDYRRGAFLPTVTGAGGASGQTYAVQEGRYCKIGRQVFVNGYVGLATLGTINGSVRIGGFPFTAAAGTQHAIGISYFANLATAITMIGAYVTGTVAEIHVCVAAGSTSTLPLGQGSLTNGSAFMFGGSYLATA